jgi:uncharacterized Zn-binding protein involved in type VI secretion
MHHIGRAVIRLGDKTDHGGVVVSVSSGTVVLGRQAALVGDMTDCPSCRGRFPIAPNDEGAHHKNRRYAYDGDLTACGAKLMSTE